MSLNESIVEVAALEWFGELGYVVGHGPHFARGEPTVERDSFRAVVLLWLLRKAIRRLNPAILSRTFATLLPRLLSGELAKRASVNRSDSVDTVSTVSSRKSPSACESAPPLPDWPRAPLPRMPRKGTPAAGAATMSGLRTLSLYASANRALMRLLEPSWGEGWSTQQVLESYPQLHSEDLQALFAYSSECVQDEQFAAIQPFCRGLTL